MGYALCSPAFRAAVDAVRQPFSVNALAQAAAAEAIRHQDDVADRVERNIVERVMVEEGVRELGLETPDSQANFSWIDLGDADEAEVVAALASAGSSSAPGPRSAARATSASATGPRTRTAGSSPRWVRSSTASGVRATRGRAASA